MSKAIGIGIFLIDPLLCLRYMVSRGDYPFGSESHVSQLDFTSMAFHSNQVFFSAGVKL